MKSNIGNNSSSNTTSPSKSEGFRTEAPVVTKRLQKLHSQPVFVGKENENMRQWLDQAEINMIAGVGEEDRVNEYT